MADLFFADATRALNTRHTKHVAFSHPSVNIGKLTICQHHRNEKTQQRSIFACFQVENNEINEDPKSRISL